MTGDEVATKGDLQKLRQEIDQQFQTAMEYIRTEAEETRRHFDVVVEQIRHDLTGAARDAHDLYRDKHENHERRITRLEVQVGTVT